MTHKGAFARCAEAGVECGSLRLDPAIARAKRRRRRGANARGPRFAAVRPIDVQRFETLYSNGGKSLPMD